MLRARGGCRDGCGSRRRRLSRPGRRARPRRRAAGRGGFPTRPGVADNSHCTPKSAEIFRGFFTAKSEHNLTALMSYFSTAEHHLHRPPAWVSACRAVRAVDSTFASAFASAPASAISIPCASSVTQEAPLSSS